MKNSTFLLVGAFLFSGIASAQHRFTKTQVKNDKVETVYIHPKMKRAGVTPQLASLAKAESNSVWKPLTERAYEFIEGGWEEFAKMDYTYDGNGNILTAILDDGETKSKVTSTYDSYNNLIETVTQLWVDGEWVNSEKKVFAYDDVVTDYQTASTYYNWDAAKNDWTVTYAHIKEITRNNNGYVTSLSIKIPGVDKEYEELERTEIAYTDGADLPATTWTYSKLDYNDKDELEFMEMTKYDKMKWESCDGQILATNESFMLGNNRLKAAKIYDNKVETAKFEASYPEGNKKRDYEVTISSISGPDKIIRKLTELDDNGSYIEKYIESLDEDQDGIMEEYEEHAIVECDNHKNVILEEGYAIMDGEKELMDGRKLEYTYGAHDEIVETIDSIWNVEELFYEPINRIVGSNFVEISITSIDNTQANSSLNCYVEDNHLVFTLKGANRYSIYNVNGERIINGNMDSETESVAVSQLPDGLYILVVEGKEGRAKAKFIKK